MKYINKSTPPQSFIDWFNLNNATFQATCTTGEEIWSKLYVAVKDKLEETILKEQGHICAYCGIRIGKDAFLTFCIEHFLRKGEPSFKHLTLEYNNMLGCCKISQQTGKEQETVFPLPNALSLKFLQEIADALGVTIENLKENNRGFRKFDALTNLEEVNYQKPVGYEIKKLFYKANIHHCDDTKWANIEPIVNPTTEIDCERYFGYNKSTNRQNIPICEIVSKNQVDSRVEKTIEILNLNATNLCTQRVEAYEAGEKLVDAILLNQPDLIQSAEDVEDIIRSDIYQKTDDKLDPFCFVTASVVWNSFLP